MSKLKCKAQKNEKIILKETSFGIDKPFALAQRGLPTPFDRTDFYTITKAVPETKEFLADLQELYLNSNQNQ